MQKYTGRKNEYQAKLIAYSSATSLFLLFAEHTEAQVIYTDVDPDIIIEAPSGTYELDLNNDAITDYIFSASSGGTTLLTSLGANVFYGTHAVFADPQYINSIAAQPGDPGFAYPYVIDSGAVVGSALVFDDASFQSLAYNFYALHGTAYSTIHDYGNWLGGKADKFVGLKFVTGGFLHYGWVRLDVDPENNAFTIKDYAYESAVNTAISTPLILPAIDTEKSEDFISAYTFNKILYIALQNNDVCQTEINIVDLTGKIVYREIKNETRIQIDISYLPVSVYVVDIVTAKGTFTKKIQLY